MPRPGATPTAALPAPSGRGSKGVVVALYFLLFLAVLVAYGPALSAGFIWDDNGHVTRADLRSLAGLGRIWSEIGATQQYYPVLHSAFWVEHRMWGDHPLGYHLLNILLHATSACLFAALLRRLAVPGAMLAAFLFALHPVCVESVAWVSEQKNTLSAVLYLCAALAYLRFDERRQPRGYLLATALFVAALLTKTVVATLPAALWVILWWQRGRLQWRRDIVPLLPWLLLGAACGLFTAHFERELIGARGADFALSGLERCLLAGRVFWFYLGKLLWPANLIFVYPRWTVDAANIDHWLWLVTALVLVAALAWCARHPAAADYKASRVAGAGDPGTGLIKAGYKFRLSARARRSSVAAVLLFGGTLFPVLGFFDVYPFRYSYVADHFQYLASLAIFALAGAGLMSVLRTGRLGEASLPAPPRRDSHGRDASPRRPLPSSSRAIFRVLPVALLSVLGGLTFSQARVYRDVYSLWETTLARNPNSWLAHNNLGIVLVDAGRIAEAIPHFETTLKLKPDFALAENNLGDSLTRLGRISEAIPHFERALQLESRYAVAHRSLGMALAMSGRTEEAVAHFAQAVQIEPTYAEAELYWAVALAQTGHATEAISHFKRVLELNPASADAHLGLADALRQLGRADEAQVHVQAAQLLGAGR